jgi:restriction system protein
VAEINVARRGLFVRTLLDILSRHPDGLPAGAALAALRQQVPPTDYELVTVSSGESRYDNNVRWATTDLRRAGWLAKAKGVWSVTDAGTAAVRAITDPERFYRQVMKQVAASRTTAVTPAGSTTTPPAEPDRTTEITFDQAEERAWAEIEQYLRAMPPFEFQDLVADLLKAMGYHIAWKSPPGKDGGIDVIAHNDPLGTRTPRIKVQVKRQLQKVDVNGLRSFMAVLGENDVGLFVATGGFTRDSDDEARKQETRKVTLIDLETFFDLWVEHLPKLDDAARRRFPLQPIYFLAPGN